MEDLRQSYKDFLATSSDMYYCNFDSHQQLIMVRIMYKLKLWLLKYDNIKSFIDLYGRKRLYEINVIWRLHGSLGIKQKYHAYLCGYHDGPLPLNYIRYIMHRNIHTDHNNR